MSAMNEQRDQARDNGESLFPQPPGSPEPAGHSPAEASPQPPRDPAQNTKQGTAVPPPHDVVTAFQLWVAVVALGVLIVPVRMIGMVLNIDDTTAMFMDQVEQQAALDLTYDQARLWSYVIVGVAGLLLLLLFGVLLLIAYAMRRGKQWARVMLTAIAVVLVVFAVPSLFGSGAGGGVTGFADSALGIVQAVLAAGTVVLMHRDESNRYFMRGRMNAQR